MENLNKEQGNENYLPTIDHRLENSEVSFVLDGKEGTFSKVTYPYEVHSSYLLKYDDKKAYWTDNLSDNHLYSDFEGNESYYEQLRDYTGAISKKDIFSKELILDEKIISVEKEAEQKDEFYLNYVKLSKKSGQYYIAEGKTKDSISTLEADGYGESYAKVLNELYSEKYKDNKGVEYDRNTLQSFTNQDEAEKVFEEYHSVDWTQQYEEFKQNLKEDLEIQGFSPSSFETNLEVSSYNNNIDRNEIKNYIEKNNNKVNRKSKELEM